MAAADITVKTSNLKGEAVADWRQHGIELLAEILTRASIPHLAVRAHMKECYISRSEWGKSSVRVRKSEPAARRVELLLTPPLSRWAFVVEIAFGGRLDTRAAVAAIAQLDTAAGGAASAPALPPPPPALPPIANGTAVRLTKMRDGIDRLLTHGADLEAAAAERDRLAAELADAQKRAELPAREWQGAHDEASAAADEERALADQVAQLEAKLAATRVALTAAEQAAVRTADRERLAEEAYAPLLAEVDRLARDRAAADELLAEKEKAVAKMGDLAPLLAALEKLG